MTCHNRKSTTLTALGALSRAADLAGIDHTTFLVEDGGTDGTAEAVRAQYPDVRLILGDGGLYWNGGMRLAWSRAAREEFDFFLWLNDDLALVPDAIADLVAEYRKHFAALAGKAIVVGKTLDPDTGEITYGGHVHAEGLSRLRWKRLAEGERFCDTMEGNCVLLPQRCLAEIGTLSDKYRHAFGDIDYGIRARRAGYAIIEAEKPVGFLPPNFQLYSGARVGFGLKSLRAVLFHPKGVPVREWWSFCRDHAGPLWPVNFCLRYVKIFLGKDASPVRPA